MSTSAVPGRLVLLATVPRALVHGTLITGISRAPSLGVLSPMFECTLAGVFVDLGDAFLASGNDHVNLCLLAAHQRPEDFLDDPVIHQSLQILGRLDHARSNSGQSERRRLPKRVLLAPGAIRLKSMRRTILLSS